jgi:hypothetical protein
LQSFVKKRPEAIQQQRIESDRRRKESFDSNILQHVNTDKLLARNYRSDDRVESKRKTREQMQKEMEEKKEQDKIEVPQNSF